MKKKIIVNVFERFRLCYLELRKQYCKSWFNDIPEAHESKSTVSVFLDTLDYRRKSKKVGRVA
jgi:hypothetical protein